MARARVIGWGMGADVSDVSFRGWYPGERTSCIRTASHGRSYQTEVVKNTRPPSVHRCLILGGKARRPNGHTAAVVKYRRAVTDIQSQQPTTDITVTAAPPPVRPFPPPRSDICPPQRRRQHSIPPLNLEELKEDKAVQFAAEVTNRFTALEAAHRMRSPQKTSGKVPRQSCRRWP